MASGPPDLHEIGAYDLAAAAAFCYWKFAAVTMLCIECCTVVIRSHAMAIIIRQIYDRFIASHIHCYTRRVVKFERPAASDVIDSRPKLYDTIRYVFYRGYRPYARADLLMFVLGFYSAPQSSHCKRCTSYGNSVRLSVRLFVCHTLVLCQNVARCSLHCQIAKCV